MHTKKPKRIKIQRHKAYLNEQGKEEALVQTDCGAEQLEEEACQRQTNFVGYRWGH